MRCYNRMRNNDITFIDAASLTDTLMNALNGGGGHTTFLESKWAIILLVMSTIAFERERSVNWYLSLSFPHILRIHSLCNRMSKEEYRIR